MKVISLPILSTAFVAALFLCCFPSIQAQMSAAEVEGNVMIMSMPINDLFPGESIAGASGSVTGTNSGASKEPNEPRHAGETGGASVWWSWIAPTEAVYTFDTFGSDFETILAVYTGDRVEELTVVARYDLAWFSDQSRVTFVTGADVLYRIAVDGSAGDTGSIVLNWKESEVANNLFPGTPIDGVSGSVEGVHADGIHEPNEPRHAGRAGEGSVWWSWTAPATGTYTFDTFRSDFDTLLAVYTGDRLEDLVEVASNDFMEGTDRSQVTFMANEGRVYRIAVDGWPGELVHSILNWEEVTDEVPPNTLFPGETITGVSGFVEGSNVAAVREPDEPRHAGERGGGSVWWSWTAPASNQYTFDTLESDFDTLLGIYTGDRMENLVAVEGDDNAEGFDRSRVTFMAEAGYVYRVAVDGWEGRRGRIGLSWRQVENGTPLTPFQRWAQEWLPEGERNELDDPGGHGIVNLVRFAFGMDAQRPDRGNLPQVTTDVITEDGQRKIRWRMTYVRRTGDTGVIPIPETSEDLETWIPGAGDETVSDSGDHETEIVTITNTEPIEVQQTLFLRVRLQQ